MLGRTGSGKTTLTRLLFRLYDPDQGCIRLGSEDALADRYPRPVPSQELRRRIGMVTQNIQLFHATVRENLTFFDTSIPDEKILEAIQDLGLGEWFQSLPNGLDTELESGWRRAFGRRGAAAGLYPHLPARPRAGHPG